MSPSPSPSRGRRVLEDLRQDLRYALRTLVQRPGFTLAAVVTVAIGIAATGVVLSAADALLVRPLPVHEPDRLVAVQESRRGVNTMRIMGYSGISYTRYLGYAEAAAPHVDLAAQRYQEFSVRPDGPPRVLYGAITSGNYFEVLGLRPELGRFYGGEQDRARQGEGVAVISHDLWRRELGSEADAVGRTIQLDGRPVTVIGVAPRGFRSTMVGISADVWVPAAVYRWGPTAASEPDLSDPEETASEPRRIWMTLFGRLEPGASLESAAAALDRIAPAVPVDDENAVVSGARLEPLTPLPSGARGTVAGFMGLLLATAGLVLLVAATNVAGMLLARATARRREVAIRLAVGAGRGRLVRQIVTESLLLFAAGGTVGLLLAWWLLGLLNGVELPVPMIVALDLSLDPGVIAVALLLVAGTGVLFGLLPALRATRADLVQELREGRTPRAAGRSLRGGFVVAQVAITVVLLVTAGLFVRTVRNTLAVDPGFDPEGVVVAGISLAPHGYDGESGPAFLERLMERVRALPEVEEASPGLFVPLTGNVNTSTARLPGQTEDDAGVDVQFGLVGARWFATLRTPLVAGRGFRISDTRPGAPAVAVVNETLARRLWPDHSPDHPASRGGAPSGAQDALGRRFRLPVGPEREVVGVARDGRYRSLTEEPRAYAYLLDTESLWAGPRIYVRTRGPAGPAVTAIRGELAALDPDVALEYASTLDEQLRLLLAPQRLAAGLIGLFGLIGLVLASVGIYGVTAYYVARRTGEIGVRMALGARGLNVVRLVVGRGVVLAAIGAGIGVAGSFAVTFLASRFLYGVGVADPVTLLVVPLLLVGVALAASWVPARRAARVDPLVALRSE